MLSSIVSLSPDATTSDDKEKQSRLDAKLEILVYIVLGSVDNLSRSLRPCSLRPESHPSWRADHDYLSTDCADVQVDSDGGFGVPKPQGRNFRCRSDWIIAGCIRSSETRSEIEYPRSQTLDPIASRSGERQ